MCHPVVVLFLAWQLLAVVFALLAFGPTVIPEPALELHVAIVRSRQFVTSSAGNPVACGLWHLEQRNRCGLLPVVSPGPSHCPTEPSLYQERKKESVRRFVRPPAVPLLYHPVALTVPG